MRGDALLECAWTSDLIPDGRVSLSVVRVYWSVVVEEARLAGMVLTSVVCVPFLALSLVSAGSCPFPHFLSLTLLP